MRGECLHPPPPTHGTTDESRLLLISSRLLAFQALLDASRDAREQVVEISTFRRLCGRGEPPSTTVPSEC